MLETHLQPLLTVIYEVVSSHEILRRATLSSTLGTELDWVEEEYLSLNLGDKRLDKRLKKIVSVMTKRGGTSLPDIFGNWSGTKGAYRVVFFESEVSSERIIEPHSQATKKRLHQQRVVSWY
ncbi:transposase DNA-binding domain protein [Leptospira alstonii serovar Pingchang str. 80-412]|uniref:Transposase DNA-binding domain protein n=1 Tax=Leptospira alstonii serovar Pingchang str. 80-412 TaxID=1218564 RepID=T0G5V7_9LEPT|nr:transposase DNA-binding domain protein [Leptospira alstonii serovar Pingchang str. 80-412]